MADSFLTRFVNNGEPVAAETVNRPMRDQQLTIDFLTEAMDALGRGQATYSPPMTVNSTARVGMPVYWDATTTQYEPAFAGAESNPLTGTLQTASTALVWGLITSKPQADQAVLLVDGYAALDISEALSAPLTVGLYYLSGTIPGGLTQTPPAIAIPVLLSDGLGNVLVRVRPVDVNESHRHYKFDLTCLPAGTVVPPAVGSPHNITAPDPTLPGWLPATHASFQGKAPTGAFFGYNLAAAPGLAALWPPLPLQGVDLVWDRGEDHLEGAQGVSLGSDGLCVIDRNGIWWMANCWRDVPWPYALNTTTPPTSLSPPDECPRTLEMHLTLWFTRVNFVTDQSAVTSLVSTDPRLVVQCQNGGPAITGPLDLSLNLNFQVSSTTTSGANVFKALTGDLIQSGPVVEGVYTTSPALSLTSNLPSQLLVSGDSASPSVYQGLVNISLTSQASVLLPALLTRLHGATEEFYKGIMYLGLGPASQTSFVTKFVIPADLQIPSPYFRVRFWLLGRTVGAIPTLTLTAQVIPRTLTQAVLPLTTTTLTLASTTTLTAADSYLEFTSSPLTVSAGALIFLSVTRQAPDGYLGQLGVIEQIGILSAT